MNKLYGYGLTLLAGLLFIAGIFFKGESVGKKSEEVKNKRLKLKEKNNENKRLKRKMKSDKKIEARNRSTDRASRYARMRKSARKDSDSV